MHTHPHTHNHTITRTHTHTHNHRHPHITQTRTHTHAHRQINTRKHTLMRTLSCTHTHTHTNTHYTYTHTNTFTHAQTRTHSHTHTHKHSRRVQGGGIARQTRILIEWRSLVQTRQRHRRAARRGVQHRSADLSKHAVYLYILSQFMYIYTDISVCRIHQNITFGCFINCAKTRSYRRRRGRFVYQYRFVYMNISYSVPKRRILETRGIFVYTHLFVCIYIRIFPHVESTRISHLDVLYTAPKHGAIEEDAVDSYINTDSCI